MAPIHPSLTRPNIFLILSAIIICSTTNPSLAFQSTFPPGASSLSLFSVSRSSSPSPPVTSTAVSSPHRSYHCHSYYLPNINKMGSALSSAASSSSNESQQQQQEQLLTPTSKTTYQNKSILLTGASRGLGRSLAHQLSKCNPSLLILSGRDARALDEVKEECLRIHRHHHSEGDCSNNGNNEKIMMMRVETITCDLADKSSVEELATQSLELAKSTATTNGSGTIDILINNGGISSRSSFLETKLEVDEKLMQVNFFSGAALAKRLVPGMVENKSGGGKIVWISSVQGKLGTPYRTSYAASKFAVQGYCEALRSELATSDITVHVASPGYIRTSLSLSAVMGDGRAYSKMDETTANGADPDEVAATILNSVSSGQTDFVVAATFSAKAALWLKFLVPSFLESMLVKRFEKAKTVESKKED